MENINNFFIADAWTAAYFVVWVVGAIAGMVATVRLTGLTASELFKTHTLATVFGKSMFVAQLAMGVAVGFIPGLNKWFAIGGSLSLVMYLAMVWVVTKPGKNATS